MKIVLASSSPRRKRLLGRIVRNFSVKAADVPERIMPGETSPHAAARLAMKKAAKIAENERASVVIGADTIAYRGNRIFRKTESEKAARKILLLLSGKIHFVVTGVAVLFPDGRGAKYAVRAAVRMKKLEGNMLASYLKSGEWKGRAGCYDFSGKGRKLVQSVRGEKETVVGLPLIRLKSIFATNNH